VETPDTFKFPVKSKFVKVFAEPTAGTPLIPL